MSVVANHARRRLAAGELVLGMVLRQARTVDIAAIAKACDFDCFSVDMEHGSFAVDNVAQIVNAALPQGITPLVRVPAHEPQNATRLLDAGAQGIIVPHVESAQAAREAVAQCKFPPLGRRSAGALPHLGFEGTARGKNAEALNAETLCIVMLESRQGIDNAADIAAVPGVDVLLVGTNDLSAELGVTGRPDDPKLEEAYRAVIEACRKSGVHAGMTGLHEAQIVTKLIGLGIRFVLGGTDLSFLMASARERTKFLRGIVAGR